MKVNFAAIVLAAFVLVPAARAQGTGGAGAASPSKVGVLSMRLAIINSAEGKQASAEFQSQFAPRQNELENLRKQIEDLQNRLRTGQTTLSDDEKVKLARQVNLMSRQYQRKEEELREDLNAAEGEVIERIGRKMAEVVDRYGRENGYAVVFDVSAQTTPVVYASNQVDITQDILRLYDQANPVRGGAQPPAAQPPAPAQARPQPGQPRPGQQPPPQKPPQQ